MQVPCLAVLQTTVQGARQYKQEVTEGHVKLIYASSCSLMQRSYTCVILPQYLFVRHRSESADDVVTEEVEGSMHHLGGQ